MHIMRNKKARAKRLMEFMRSEYPSIAARWDRERRQRGNWRRRRRR